MLLDAAEHQFDSPLLLCRGMIWTVETPLVGSVILPPFCRSP